MAYAHCMRETYSYKYVLRVCISYCCSAATMVARTLLIVTLYLRCMSCSSLCLQMNLVYRRKSYGARKLCIV